MNVGQLMKSGARSCHMNDSLAHAAQIMFDNDCGCVVVEDDSAHPVGMITDRDICMSAYLQGRPLGSLLVANAMSRAIYSCRPDDSIPEAVAIMRAHRVRRLPVVAAGGDVVGIISLDDIADEAGRGDRNAAGEVTYAEVGETLRVVTRPRGRQLAII